MGKKRSKTERTHVVEEEPVVLPPTVRFSDEPPAKKVKWINRQRVLVFSARGISHRDRHLLEDLRSLLPHCRSENKLEKRENLFVINELCEIRNCNKAIFFEGRLQRDLYMWLANAPSGPSAKFLVENVYTMAELKFTGNCLKGSRPLLSFDKSFEGAPHYQVLKELLIQIFGTPNGHPKSQPFVDHVLTFSIMDNRIWFRNYQILAEDGALAEIGPRFVLNPIKIFDGSFGGATLWENPHYVSPAKYRRMINKKAASKYLGRVTQKAHRALDRPSKTYALDYNDDIFTGDSFEKAQEIVEKEEEPKEDISKPVPDKKKKKRKVKVPTLEGAQVNGIATKPQNSSGKSPKKSPMKGKLKSKVAVSTKSPVKGKKSAKVVVSKQSPVKEKQSSNVAVSKSKKRKNMIAAIKLKKAKAKAVKSKMM